MRVKTCFAAVLLLTANLAPRPAVAEEPSAASCETCDGARDALGRPEFQRALLHGAAQSGGEIPEPLTIRGQDPSMQGAAGVPGMPPGGPYQRGLYQPGQGGIPDGYFDPTAAPNAIPGDPNSPMYPFPGISPFDYRHQQTMNKKGLWFWEGNNRKRQFYTSFEYITVRTKTPNGRVGHEDAPSYLEMLAGRLLTEPFDLTFVIDQSLPNPELNQVGLNYFNAVDADLIGRLTSNGGRVNWGYWNPDDSGFKAEFLFAIDDGDNDFDFERDKSTRHPRLQNLFETALLSPEGRNSVNFSGFNFGPNATLGEVFEQNLLNLGSIPLDDGSFTYDQNGNVISGGVGSPYDLAFVLRYKSQRYGSTMTWYGAPVINASYFKLRPVLSGRFVALQESFQFIGVDSGLYYDNQAIDEPLIPDVKLQSPADGIDNNFDGIIDNAASIEGAEGAEDLQVLLEAQIEELEEIQDQLIDAFLTAVDPNVRANIQAQIAAVQVQIDDLLNRLAQAIAAGAAADVTGRFIPLSEPIRSHLNSDVDSYMAGPELGIRYDIGGTKFKIWGQSSIAVLGNWERINLKGNNIGMTTRPVLTVDPSLYAPGIFDGLLPPAFNAPTLQDQNPNNFEEKRDHAHVSPLFEQSLFAEAPIFDRIPVLNKIQILEEAQFRVGYTFTWIGSVLRPEDAIVWQGNPAQGLYPEIKVDRSSWYSGAWSFGINFNY